MSFHQCTEMFVQLNVLCLGNWLHAPLCKKCEEVLVFSIFHPTRLFRPTQLLIWMNFPPYTIIPHCTAIRHFTESTYYVACKKAILYVCCRSRNRAVRLGVAVSHSSDSLTQSERCSRYNLLQVTAILLCNV